MTNHYVADVRWPIMGAVALLFHKTTVQFTCARVTRRMPMLLAFLLIAGFIWLGENIGTLLGAWRYPYQADAWRPVHVDKLTSWFLLAIVSLVIVGELKRWKKEMPATSPLVARA
jgi:uncharacterized membrane protein YoaT (DUF817 family)